MVKKLRCIVCGALKEDGMRDCGKHSLADYNKIKARVWNDPWVYFPIGFGGFVCLLIGITSFIGNNIQLEQVPTIANIILIVSFIIPISICILLHNYRQKKKELPFWGLTDEQEVERLLGDNVK